MEHFFTSPIGGFHFPNNACRINKLHKDKTKGILKKMSILLLRKPVKGCDDLTHVPKQGNGEKMNQKEN